MRPPSIDATVPVQAHAELLTTLHGPWRVATRALMIVLSGRGWSASAIAELLGYDPVTVRRSHPPVRPARHRWPGRPAPPGPPPAGQPPAGQPPAGQRIRRLLARPRAWTIPLLHLYLGHPAKSLRTLRRRVREVAAWRRPRLVATGAPDADQVTAEIRAAIATLPDGAVVLAEDETHLNLLPWVRSTWIAHGTRQPVMTPGTNRRRSSFGAVDLTSGRFFDQVARRAVSATFIAFAATSLRAIPTRRWW